MIQKLVLFPGLERWQILATDGAVVPTGLHMLRLHMLKQAGFELSVPGTIQTPPQSTISNHLPQHCLGDTVKTIWRGSKDNVPCTVLQISNMGNKAYMQYISLIVNRSDWKSVCDIWTCASLARNSSDRTCHTERSCIQGCPRAWPPRGQMSSICIWTPSRRINTSTLPQKNAFLTRLLQTPPAPGLGHD